jgi:hypothetical protein
VVGDAEEAPGRQLLFELGLAAEVVVVEGAEQRQDAADEARIAQREIVRADRQRHLLTEGGKGVPHLVEARTGFRREDQHRMDVIRTEPRRREEG